MCAILVHMFMTKVTKVKLCILFKLYILHVLKYFVVGQHLEGQISVSWEDTRTVEEWLNGQPHQSWKQAFEEQGVLVSFMVLDKYAEILLFLTFQCILFLSCLYNFILN